MIMTFMEHFKRIQGNPASSQIIFITVRFKSRPNNSSRSTKFPTRRSRRAPHPPVISWQQPPLYQSGVNSLPSSPPFSDQA
ncbi:hypothetical protein GWI33_005266 [Rhynchophorus ferrugineus]|uniref:Uncharacterized protein n=1 Tax=Rhynchophorus ferrugineus TaxID=354439 RepID=A0A834IJJ1_RHYFE|nr:hypothetical protein GWI33_005266 [Rhynchophorus ferrugineus]